VKWYWLTWRYTALLLLDGARVAVTGAGGFIGASVMRALIEAGAEPLAIIGPDNASTPSGEVTQGNLTNPAFAAAALSSADGVIHLAARSGGIRTQGKDDILSFNQAITSSVFDAASVTTTKRVFAASSAVIYQDSLQPLVESDPMTPRDEANPYAVSKMDDEQEGIGRTARGEISVVFGRLGNVIGPVPPNAPRRTTVVYDLISKAAAATKSIEVWGDGTAIRSFVHVDDVGAAIVKVFTSGASGEAYNIDSGDPVQMGDLAQLIRDRVAPAAELRFDPEKPTGPAYRVLEMDKLNRLGFSSRWSSIEAVDDTLRSLGF